MKNMLMSLNLRSLFFSLPITLAIVLAIEVSGYLSMQEIGLGAKWLLHHFSQERLSNYLTFVITTFSLVHLLIMCLLGFGQLHKYDKELEEAGEE